MDINLFIRIDICFVVCFDVAYRRKMMMMVADDFEEDDDICL